MLKLIDPLLMSSGDEEESDKTDSARVRECAPDEKVLIELYKKPIVKYGILPGSYYYLHVTSPGLLKTYEEERLEVSYFFYNNYFFLNKINII